MLEEKDLDVKFQTVFSSLITDIELRNEMRTQLKAMAKPEAAQAIVNEILNLT